MVFQKLRRVGRALIEGRVERVIVFKGVGNFSFY